jgi:hypothetical protein
VAKGALMMREQAARVSGRAIEEQSSRRAGITGVAGYATVAGIAGITDV